MSIWKRMFNVTKRTPALWNKNWKQGMWITTSTGKVGILYKLSDPCNIHIVSRDTGETVEELVLPITELRQATWSEIPECRRGITKAQAEALGYGS